MVLFNYATKEITAKVVYYGPGLCGKTTNLQFVYDSLPSNNKSKMLSLATKTDRTLFFDFLPLDLGKIRGMRTKLQLYTVPGQVYYNSTRQLVLKGADGVVFVADSQDYALDANQESFQNLEDNLKRQGLRLREMPLVFQWNKRDLPNALPLGELEEAMNRDKAPSFPAVAMNGLGVEQTLKGIAQLVLNHLIKKYGLEGSEPLDKEIQVLNAGVSDDNAAGADSIWTEEEVIATTVATPQSPASTSPFLIDDDDDEDIPMVSTELLASSAPTQVVASPVVNRSPFDDLMQRFETPGAVKREEMSMEVPFASVEMKLPEGFMDSLPKLDPSPAPAPAAVPGPGSLAATQTEAERRASDGLVKEVSLPLNLSLEELRRHRKLKVRITLDINLLP